MDWIITLIPVALLVLMIALPERKTRYGMPDLSRREAAIGFLWIILGQLAVLLFIAALV